MREKIMRYRIMERLHYVLTTACKFYQWKTVFGQKSSGVNNPKVPGKSRATAR
jgi:hypothetical protein